MRSFTIRFPEFCLTVLLVCTPLCAQSRTYHLEQSESRRSDDGARTYSRVVVVNDSDKPIEAFHLTERCENAPISAGSRAVGDGSQDTLNSSGTLVSITGLDNKVSFQSTTIQPSGRFVTWLTLVSGPDTQKCNGQIDAVIFADGSFGGDEAQVRGLQAQRDGISAVVDYWVDRFDRTKPGELNMDSILAEMKSRASIDEQKARGYVFAHMDDRKASVAYEYWMGRRQTEETLVQSLPQDWTNNLHSLATWKEKIESNIAKWKLDTVFPLPSELVEKTDSTSIEAKRPTSSR